MQDASTAQQEAVALIQKDKAGELRATGAFDRFDLPFSRGKAKPGDLLLIRRHGRGAAKVRHLGRPSSVESVIDALALHHGEHKHSSRQEDQACGAVRRAPRRRRRDLRKLPTFTIDGERTRDFDDAISARREGNKIRVWVHVADVAAYVKPGSALDQDARRRASSVYLPTLTVPMLPEALSTGVCSLSEGNDRAAVTCELLLNNGRVVDRRFYRSLIRSDARLTYSHVEDIFLGRAEPGPTYAAALAAARQAAVDRQGEDERQEFRAEPIFEISGGEVTGVRYRPQEESQRLIEKLMVLANQEVATFLAANGTPVLYRVHDASDPERMRTLMARLRSLGVQVTEPTFTAAATAIAAYENQHGPRPAFHELLLSCRAPAQYSTTASGHEGLGVGNYCHFTSPIRRYADLTVHRALLRAIGDDDRGPAESRESLDALSEHLNERSRQLRKLDRRAEAICQVSLIRRRIRQGKLSRSQLEGTISGISTAGCFIALAGTEGLLSARAIGGAANPENTIWSAGNRSLRLGDHIKVRIRALDPVKGQLALALT